MNSMFNLISNKVGGEMVQMVLLFAAMFAILYFVTIRPQQKQQKNHQLLISSLKKGDEIMLSCGIIGKIGLIDEKIITLEFGDKTKIKVMKHAVQSLVKKSDAS